MKELPLADDQVIVAGEIDVLTNFVEHPEGVAERLERVAQMVIQMTSPGCSVR